MSRVDDPTIKMELEDLDERVNKLEQSIKGDRESSSAKNSEAQLNTYRVIKEDYFFI